MILFFLWHLFFIGDSYIALTFDDGVHKRTRNILKVLNKHQVKATFFPVGKNIVQNAIWLRDVHDGGHEIENHTFHHYDMRKHNCDFQIKDIIDENRIVELITGYRPVFYRPPNGMLTSCVKNNINKLNMSIVKWDLDSLDIEYARTKPWIVKNRVTAFLSGRYNGILLMHSIYWFYPKLLDILFSRKPDNLHLVTVSEYEFIKKHNGIVRIFIDIFYRIKWR